MGPITMAALSDRCSRSRIPFIAILLICGVGCGRSSSTSVVGPTPSKCAVSVTNSTPEVPAGGGAGTLTVNAQRECVWSARAEASWITLSGTSGQGAATVSYTVAPNPDGTPRRGHVVVSEQMVEIVQVAAPCRFSVTPSTVEVDAAGDQVSVNLTAPGGCTWRVRSDVSWVTRTAPDEGSGSATIRLTVAPNTGELRRGTVTIAGVTVQLRQSGPGDAPPPPPPAPTPDPPAPAPDPPTPTCSYTVSPTRVSAESSGEQAVVNVTAQNGCTWDASSSVAWIAVEGGGTGSGSARLVISGNAGAARTGSVTVAGKAVTVEQEAGRTACTYAIKPTYYDAGRGPDDIRISVTAPNGCAWTATSPARWVTVAQGRNGSGDGTVRLVVEANNGSERRADLTIAGITFRLRQYGCSTSIKPTWYHAGRGPDDISIAVSAQGGCTWTAASTVAWVTVAEGRTGSGDGTVRLLVEPNSGDERSVTLIIAGERFELRQSGAN
jgi:Putative binding domain, N-terminal/Viral BACON domain